MNLFKHLHLKMAMLCIGAVLWCSQGMVAYADTYVAIDSFFYLLNEESHTATVTRYTGVLAEVEIPSSITNKGDEYSVTSIGSSAFYNCTNLTSVTIPNSVTEIGDQAFLSCSRLTSVTIPNSVTEIGPYAFYQCSSLTSVTIPNSVTSIGSATFGSCTSLTSVTIPNSVTEIGGFAFNLCSSLTSVTIPNSVTSIGSATFSDCTSLTSVTIPNSVTSIGSSAFDGCSGLTSLTIPNAVTSIGSSAFAGCTSLSSIVCKAVTPPAIQERTFYGCYGANLFAASQDYKTADYWKNFSNILVVTAYEAAGTTFEIDGFKYELVSLSERTCRLYGIDESVVGEHVVIPESVEYMNRQFAIVEIKGTLIDGESSIKTLTVPSSVTTISEGMIFDASLEKLTICASITSDILGLSSIDELVITPSVTKFSTGLLCNSIGKITIEDSDTPLTTSTFTCETPSLYLGRNVSDYTFYGMTTLKNVTFSDKLTSIDYGAFRDCRGLTSLSIPNAITSIGDFAFYGCTGLTSVAIPNSVTSIGSYAFCSCDGLTGTLTIPNSVTSIGQSAFSGCTGISQLTFEDGDATLAISSDAFKSTSLTEVYFGRQMDFTKVPCENLETVELGKHVTSMVKGAFTEDNAVRTVISHNPIPPTADDVDIFSTRTYLEGELYVPEASIQAYQAANGWKLFGVVKALPDDSDGDTNNTVIQIATIQLDATEATLNEGATLQLNATVAPESADNKILQWTSSDNSVATVDETGKVSAIAQGSVLITATATDGSGVTATCTIKVVKQVATIQLDASEATLNEGATLQLNAVVAPESADNKALQWSSSNTAVATVDETGTVSAISQGSVLITATSTDGSKVTATCAIKVVKLVSTIQLDATEATLNEGETLQLNAVVAPESAENKTLQWTSSDNSVATVDETGKVSAIAQGSALITATSTDGSKVTATCTIKVVKLVSTIQLDATEATLNEGETLQLNAVVAPESADNKTLQWSSSNTAVATVDETGTVSAISQGSALITATSTDGSKVTATCTITVLKPVTGIYTDVQELSLEVGESVSIVAYATPTDATNTTLAWSSSDEAVATVKDGVVSAIAEGTATITVRTTDGSNISQTCLVHVSNSSGIGSVTGDAPISISAKHGVVYVSGKAPDDEVSVYTMSGTLLVKTKDNRIPLSQSGAFIIRVKQIAQKIVL